MTNQNLAKKPQTIRELLVSQKKQLELALPKHITADKMMRVALSEINRNPALQDCTALSLFQCIVIASQLGLFPDSLTGESYLVPFNNNRARTKEAQLMIGYQGLLKLAYQSNQVSNITAKEVYENDKFSYKYGLKPDLIHVPASANRGKIVAYYAVANLMNGGATFEVMSKEDVTAHMNKYSKACKSSSSPWQTQFDEMAKKTVIRKIVKLLPRSTENLMTAVKIDEHADLCIQSDLSPVLDGDFTTEPEPEPQSKAEKLAEELKEKEKQQKTDITTDITDDLNKISLAQSEKELNSVYDAAFDKAQKARDGAGMTALANARNKRKEELEKENG